MGKKEEKVKKEEKEIVKNETINKPKNIELPIIIICIVVAILMYCVPFFIAFCFFDEIDGRSHDFQVLDIYLIVSLLFQLKYQI